MKKLLLAVRAVSISVVLSMSGNVYAGTDTTSFNATITITSACDIHTNPATNMAFGSVASTATNVSATSTLTVNCTLLTPYTIALDNGLHGSSGPVRAMQDTGTNQVGYQLYRDALHTLVWGSTTGTGGNVFSGAGLGTATPVTVYGLVSSANSPAGSYTDTVVATLTY